MANLHFGGCLQHNSSPPFSASIGTMSGIGASSKIGTQTIG